MTVLELRQLSVTYRGRSERGQTVAIPAVRGIDLSMEAGETVGVAGESGCGKSTIANAVLRLLPSTAETSGEVLLGGEEVAAMRPGRLRAVRWTSAAIVFQGALHSLNPVQRVGDQIAEVILLHDSATTNAAAARRSGELLERVGLLAVTAQRFPHELSGGQKQRVLIALALACDPALLIADEPTTALDVMIQAQVLSLLAELQRERGMALLFISHDLSVLATTCARLAVMYAGRIVEDGPSSEIVTDPQHPYTAGLLGSFPRVGDPASRLRPSGLPGDPPDPTALPHGCSFQARCPRVVDACRQADVHPVTLLPGRSVACVHAGAMP
jgi:peptide/nickel transport system ATP-binding protein